MANWVRMTIATALVGLVGTSEAVRGQQVIERDTKVTGPRGRTTERDIRVQRGPGYIDRQVEIKRPGETLIRDTRIQTPIGRPPGPGFGGPGFVGGPRFYGRPIVENVIVQRPPVFAGFFGLPAVSLFLGGNSAPPPPPPPQVVVVPGPGYGQQQPPVVVEAPPAQPADAVTDAIGRLKSHHSNSRRDGALTRGRIGDDRAVGSLIDRLEHDNEEGSPGRRRLGPRRDRRRAGPLRLSRGPRSTTRSTRSARPPRSPIGSYLPPARARAPPPVSFPCRPRIA